MNVGTDLLILNGDIVWEGENLATVSDVDNVQQQAYLRILTELQESLFFDDYGSKLRYYLSKPFTSENKERAEAEAASVLLQVGDADGQGWIEQVLVCQIDLVEVDGKQVKMLFAKYKLRDDEDVQESIFDLGGAL